MIYAKHPRLHEIYESYAFNGESFAKLPEKYYIFPYENELNGLSYFVSIFCGITLILHGKQNIYQRSSGLRIEV